MAYIGNDVDAIFIPGSVNTSTNLTITGGGLTQTGGDVNFDSGTLFIDEDLNRVGIGITNPNAILDVKVASDAKLLVQDGNTAGNVKFNAVNSAVNANVNLEIAAFNTQFFNGGVERVRITGTGNVGIGTTNPQYGLDVNHGTVRFGQGTFGQIAFRASSYGQISSDAALYLDGAPTYFRNAGGTVENMRITSAGTVGIGTTNPASELHVRHNDNNTAEITIEGGGTGNAGLRLIPGGQTNEYYVYVDTNRNFRIQDYTSERFRINSSGNVGIGSETPGKKLDVAGTIRSNTTSASLELVSSNAGSSSISFLNGVTYEGYIQSVGSGGGLIFATGPSATERVRIDSSGNLCVGRNSSYTRLTVSNGGSTRSGITISDGDTASLMLFAGGAQPAVISTDAIHQSLIFKRGSNVGTENGVETMRINGSGNVGIATTNPVATLHVNGNTYINGNITQPWGDTTIASIFNDSYRQGWAYSTADRTLKIFSTTNDAGGVIAFHTRVGLGTTSTDYGTERMRIGPTGNVGIGITNPSTRLDVLTTNYPTAEFNSTYTTASKQYTAIVVGPLAANQSGTVGNVYDTVTAANSFFHITPYGNTEGSSLSINNLSGNVGIGTTNPAYKLSVLGTAGRFSDLLGNTIQVRIAASEGGWNSLIGFAANSGTFLGGMLGNGQSQSITDLRLGVGASPNSLVIDSSGRALVGYTSSSVGAGANDLLQVSGAIQAIASTNVYSRLVPTSTGLNIIANAYPANLGTNQSIILSSGTAGGGGPIEIARFISTGNVGIGTTNPGATLHVSNYGAGGTCFYVGGSTRNFQILEQTGTRNFQDLRLRFDDNTINSPIKLFNNIDGGGFGTGISFYGRNDVSNAAIFTVQNSAGSANCRLQLDATIGTGLVIGSTGNVGVGVTNPAYKLDINGGAYATTTIQAANSIMGNGTGAAFAVFGSNSASRGVLITRDADPLGNDIFINSSGLVGMGTQSPAYKLQVHGAIAATNGITLRTNGSGTVGTNGRASIAFTEGGFNVGTGASFLLEFDGENLSDSYNALCFRNSAASTDIVRMNLGGEVWIGYTSSNGSQYRLQVNSQIFATSATIATSDGRYKENVETLTGGMDLVKALRPVSFTWKPQQDILGPGPSGDNVVLREAHNFPEGYQVGFIAQEVQQAISSRSWAGSIIKENKRPAVLSPEGEEIAPEEEFYGIAEGNMVAILTSALKEAISKIEELEERVQALEGS